MADSDEEYVGEVTEDEDDLQVTRRNQPGTRKRKQRAAAEWELSRTWETLVEGADGTINSAVEGLLEASKRKRLLKDTTPLQRGIIRHLMLILDLSQPMSEKDLRPSRYLLTIRYAQEFVREFFEQNPISQLGILGLRDGLSISVSDMSGNPTDHILAIQSLKLEDPKGLPSLQNGLDMARSALSHTPSHGTKEVLVILGSLLSSDPGDIYKTIDTLVDDKVRVRIVGLAAQVAICRELCAKTNPGDQTAYGVVLNEQHFRELMMDVTTPPAAYSTKKEVTSMLKMGFPSRTMNSIGSICKCHSKPVRGGYSCSRCGHRVCSLPSECPACGLTLILSTHLARSYHHLFPLMNWVEVPWKRAKKSTACFSCGIAFPAVPENPSQGSELHTKGTSVSSRYECTSCHNHFCIDCDLFAHEVVHNCPGCQSGNNQAAGTKTV